MPPLDGYLLYKKYALAALCGAVVIALAVAAVRRRALRGRLIGGAAFYAVCGAALLVEAQTRQWWASGW